MPIRSIELRYGAMPAETLYLLSPGRLRSRPTIVFVHGGGWQRSILLPREIENAWSWARQSGWTIACVDYPTGLHPYWRTQPQAIAKAVAFVRRLPQVDP